MERARTARSRPIYEVDRQHDQDGRPTTITIRPVAVAGANVSVETIMETIGNNLRREVLRRLRSYLPNPPWTDHAMRRDIYGLLQMEDRGPSNSHTCEPVHLYQITAERCLEAYERATGSGSNAELGKPHTYLTI